MHLDRQFRERRQSVPARRFELLVEVQPLPANHEVKHRPPRFGQMTRLDEDTPHQVPLAADGLVDEGVGWSESSPAHGFSSSAAPTESATARSLAAKARA
jgi:hypothetical protein